MPEKNIGLFQRIGARLLFGKRSGSILSTLSNPQQWFNDAFSRASRTGVSVTEQSSLRCSAVFACVRVLSETVASLPLLTYERQARGKTRAINHPVYALLKDRPNPEMTSYAYRQLVMAHMALFGNAYSFIEYNNSGYPIALWPMLPSKMAIYRNSAGDIEFVYSMPSGEQRAFRRDQILHTMMITLDGVAGLSPIAYAREAVGLSLAMEEFGALYFANGTNIGGFVGTDKGLSPEAFERLKKQINEKYEGLGKSHKLIILEEGLKYEKVGIPPEDSQYLESRKFQALEIARIFRVPPHLIADLDRATFSNIEQQALEFISYSIRPWLVNLEQTYNWQLFTATERKKYFVEHLIDGILRGDIQTRYNAYAVGKQNGWLSVNDIRELENLNPVDGGDMYMSPLNMIPSDKMEDYYKNVITKDKSTKTETK